MDITTGGNKGKIEELRFMTQDRIMLHTIQDARIKLREEFRRICPYLIGVQSDSLVTLDGDVVVNGYVRYIRMVRYAWYE